MTAFSHRYVEDCHRFRVFVLKLIFISILHNCFKTYTNLTET